MKGCFFLFFPLRLLANSFSPSSKNVIHCIGWFKNIYLGGGKEFPPPQFSCVKTSTRFDISFYCAGLLKLVTMTGLVDAWQWWKAGCLKFNMDGRNTKWQKSHILKRIWIGNRIPVCHWEHFDHFDLLNFYNNIQMEWNWSPLILDSLWCTNHYVTGIIFSMSS